MKLAYIIFDGITWLDLIGIYDPVSRLKSHGYLPDLHWEICSFTTVVRDNFGLQLLPTIINASLAGYDAVIVPGGSGTRRLMEDQHFLDWFKTAAPAKYKISICTGSLLLGAAGWLNGKKATTHFNEYETLKPFCKEVSAERIVEDNDIITAGAVAASLDLGLYLCNKWAGPEAAAAISSSMNYTGKI